MTRQTANQELIFAIVVSGIWGAVVFALTYKVLFLLNFMLNDCGVTR